MRGSRHSYSLPGFTLVELLAVTGIAAVVLALVLSTVLRARREAQRIACLSNLRQIAAAFIAYGTDHDGWLPAPAGVDRVFPEDWVYWQPDRDVSQGRLMRYLARNQNVLSCPSGYTERTTKPPYPFSYSVNNWFTGSTAGTYFGGGWTVRPTKLGLCKDPSMKILLIEEEITAINDGEWWADNSERGIYRETTFSAIHDKGREYGGGAVVDDQYSHRGRGNVAFADGRCDFIDRSRLLRTGYVDPRVHGGPY